MTVPAEITSRPPGAAFTAALVQPPARVYLTRDDRLYIRSRNSLAGVELTLAGRLLRADGTVSHFRETHTPATDRSASLEAFHLAEGYLLSAVVFPSTGAPLRGQTFVELGLLRGVGAGADVVDVLAKDYVAEAEPIAFPGSPVRSSLEGPGVMRSVTGTNPAAGAEISETVPTDAAWRLYSLAATLVTDATVASRVASIRLDDGTLTYFGAITATVIAASSTVLVSFSDVGAAAGVATALVGIPTLSGVRLPAGHRIRTVTANIQAGDDWGAPQLLVEEYLED